MLTLARTFEQHAHAGKKFWAMYSRGPNSFEQYTHAGQKSSFEQLLDVNNYSAFAGTDGFSATARNQALRFTVSVYVSTQCYSS